MGETGETYLVGKDLLMRSDSRFETTSTILKKTVDTDASKNALQDRTGTGIIKDYRDEKVLSSYSHVGLNESLGIDLEWAIISEIDKAEAFAPARTLGLRIALIGLGIGLGVVAVAYFVAKGIASPIKRISQQVVKVAEGDLTIDVATNGRVDEVGILAQKFRTMVENLRKQTGDITEGMEILATSAAEMSASTTQLAASANNIQELNIVKILFK